MLTLLLQFLPLIPAGDKRTDFDISFEKKKEKKNKNRGFFFIVIVIIYELLKVNWKLCDIQAHFSLWLWV